MPFFMSNAPDVVQRSVILRMIVHTQLTVI